MQIFRKFHSFFGFDFLISEQYMEIHKKYGNSQKNVINWSKGQGVSENKF